MKVIKVTLVIQQKYNVENKFNFVSRKEMELKIS